MSAIDHFKQAKYWLSAAQNLMASPEKDASKYTVVVSLSIHSVIKANDALTTRFLRRTARRHDEAPRLFEEIIGTAGITAEDSRLGETLREMIQRKAAANYHAEFFSKRDAESFLLKAEKFLKMIEKYL